MILALMSFIVPNEGVVTAANWSPAQFEELQLHALAALCTLCPLMIGTDWKSGEKKSGIKKSENENQKLKS